jgi:tetratricopeptide (TPR) repeat protein
MFAHSQPNFHAEMELLKWIALVIVAGAIALVLARPVTGDIATIKGTAAPEVGAPAPAHLADLSVPGGEASEDHFAVTAIVWEALQQQRDGNLPQALAMWREVQLPGSADVWRKVAIALAELQLNELPQAAVTLGEARAEAPQNALVYYLTGVLRLAQADRAEEWYDASGLDWTQLVSGPLDTVPNTKSLYELAARMALEQSVALAGEVCGDEPLVPESWTRTPDFEVTMPLATPLVQDLLEACGLEPYEGRAHLVLGEMHRQRGSLSHAEEHLDRAAELGIPTGAAYRMLGGAYEKEGLSAEAARAYLKAISHGREVAAPALKALENLRDALLHSF